MKIPEPWLRNTHPGCTGASDLSGHQTCHTVEQRAELKNFQCQTQDHIEKDVHLKK